MTWTLGGAPPLFATGRDRSLPTDGAQVAVVADALGTPLMPWQRYTADVAGERLPSGAYRYPIVVVSVPRQSGKTTLMRSVGVTRGLRQPGHETFYTAQTGKDARERWRDLIRQVAASPALSARCQVRSAAGSERLLLPGQSTFRCFSPVSTSLHGYTPPLVMLDEAFAHDGPTGEDLMGAIVPAQSTLPNRQLWIVSTAGTSESTFLRSWVDQGRERADGVALLLWAADDGVDVYDPATWPTFHPAHGYTIGDEAIASAAASLSRAEFERAYGNRWTLTTTHVIPADTWRARAGEQTPPAPDQAVVLTFDVAHDRRSATLLATWHDDTGRHQQRIVQAGPGYSWLVQAVQEARDGLAARMIGADDGGPVRQVTDELRRLGLAVETLGARDYATACSAWLGRVEDGGMVHDGTAPFAAAAQGITLRPMGDGVAISRRHSTGDVSAAVSAVVGSWLLDRVPAPEGPPMIYLGGNR